MERELDPMDTPDDGPNTGSRDEEDALSERIVAHVKPGMAEEKTAEMAVFGWALVDQDSSTEMMALHFKRTIDSRLLDDLRRLEEEYQGLSSQIAGGPGALLILTIVVIPCALWALLVNGDLFLMTLFVWGAAIAWVLVSDRTASEKEKVLARKEEIVSRARELLSRE